jgi:pimeloyl-ACP methyl ester carboxylesterase
MSHPPVTGYAAVSGTDVYWESRGDGGTPLVVVHGGFGVTSMFGPVLDQLAGPRQVIAIELPGHGHTRDHGRPFTWEGFGDDIAAVIEHLGLGQADLLGYSLGGAASLRTAIQHPGLVRRLAVVSAPCRRDGWFPGVRAGMDQLSAATFAPVTQHPLYQVYRAVAPDPAAFPALFFALLGGGLADAGWDGSGRGTSRLAILPGATHYDIFQAPQLAATVAAFLA